jgi:hypothetical protein
VVQERGKSEIFCKGKKKKKRKEKKSLVVARC